MAVRVQFQHTHVVFVALRLLFLRAFPFSPLLYQSSGAVRLTVSPFGPAVNKGTHSNALLLLTAFLLRAIFFCNRFLFTTCTGILKEGTR
jgi:hypothetical protein